MDMPSSAPSNVTLFIPCIMDALFPHMARDLVSLLRKLGFGVAYPPEQTCCGQPAFNQGFHKQAKSLAKRFLSLFDSAEVIVCPSGSCTAMVQRHYPELLSADSTWQAKAESTAGRIFELCQFLDRFVPPEAIKTAFPFPVTYHDSCHSNRILGIREEPRRLLSLVKGLTFVEMDPSDKCCGFGGLFSQKFPEISRAIGQDKIRAIQNTGAQWVISNEPGCLMNIQSSLLEQGIAVGTKHIVEVLNYGL
jgi:L-lactate dehydrogenase complex protein LldE